MTLILALLGCWADTDADVDEVFTLEVTPETSIADGTSTGQATACLADAVVDPWGPEDTDVDMTVTLSLSGGSWAGVAPEADYTARLGDQECVTPSFVMPTDTDEVWVTAEFLGYTREVEVPLAPVSLDDIVLDLSTTTLDSSQPQTITLTATALGVGGAPASAGTRVSFAVTAQGGSVMAVPELDVVEDDTDQASTDLHVAAGTTQVIVTVVATPPAWATAATATSATRSVTLTAQ